MPPNTPSDLRELTRHRPTDQLTRGISVLAGFVFVGCRRNGPHQILQEYQGGSALSVLARWVDECKPVSVDNGAAGE